MSEETLSFGEAIELIKKDTTKIMHRQAWHGVQLGKKMGITFRLKSDIIPFDNNGNDYIINGIFLFISGDNTYAWTPSQHDMMSDDWVIVSHTI